MIRDNEPLPSDGTYPGPGLDALGAYHLLRPIATGGMARVWLAVDARDGRQVAVKRILGSVAVDPELRNAFADEGHLGMRLRHPNIVQTLDVGDSVNASAVEPYLVLELLQGRALIEVLRAASRQKRRIPLEFAIRAVCDAARGLDHAHKLVADDGHPLGIVHRDVTPHNLFVCASGSVKVLDFGIAKTRAQHHKTRAGVVKGKFAYLAPEQIRGKVPDARIDVFALGIVLYELITGVPLFRGANDAETLQRVLSLEVPAPEKLRVDVPVGLGAITLRALQRERDRRLPSAGALADALEAVATAEGLRPRPAAVRDFIAELFPLDAHEHAEDNALARRTYQHLSSSSLRALSSNPWITPAQGSSMSAHDRPGSPWRRGAALLGAFVLTAAAALVTATLLSHRARRALPVTPTERATAAPIAPRAAPANELPSIPSPAPTLREPTRVQSATTPSSASPTRAHHAHAGSGQLRLAAQPWAEVTIDGHVLGTTPLKPTSLSEGPHTIVFKNEQLGVSVKRHVTVQANKETVLVVNLFNEGR
jgi:serine/threonine protein kinase